jgi:hypothetical protein
VNEVWVAGTLTVDAGSTPAEERGARLTVSADLDEAWKEYVAIMLADAARLAWEGHRRCPQTSRATHTGQDSTHA